MLTCPFCEKSELILDTVRPVSIPLTTDGTICNIPSLESIDDNEYIELVLNSGYLEDSTVYCSNCGRYLHPIFNDNGTIVVGFEEKKK